MINANYIIKLTIVHLLAFKFTSQQFLPPDDCVQIYCGGIFCQYGMEKDFNGCPTCNCIRDPCENMLCPPEQYCQVQWSCSQPPCPVCVQVQPCQPCQLEKICPYGFQLDINGCPTCECIRDPCETVLCPPKQFCQVQWSSCSHPPCPVCVPSQQCPNQPCHTNMNCPYGFQLDNNGCPTCCCNNNPCDNIKCPNAYHCEIQQVTNPNIPMAICKL